jgi:hypothetical protein
MKKKVVAKERMEPAREDTAMLDVAPRVSIPAVFLNTAGENVTMKKPYSTVLFHIIVKY